MIWLDAHLSPRFWTQASASWKSDKPWDPLIVIHKDPGSVAATISKSRLHFFLGNKEPGVILFGG